MKRQNKCPPKDPNYVFLIALISDYGIHSKARVHFVFKLYMLEVGKIFRVCSGQLLSKVEKEGSSGKPVTGSFGFRQAAVAQDAEEINVGFNR